MLVKMLKIDGACVAHTMKLASSLSQAKFIATGYRANIAIPNRNRPAPKAYTPLTAAVNVMAATPSKQIVP